MTLLLAGLCAAVVTPAEPTTGGKRGAGDQLELAFDAPPANGSGPVAAPRKRSGTGTPSDASERAGVALARAGVPIPARCPVTGEAHLPPGRLSLLPPGRRRSLRPSGGRGQSATKEKTVTLAYRLALESALLRVTPLKSAPGTWPTAPRPASAAPRTAGEHHAAW